MDQRPEQPPEGRLIADAAERHRLSIREAARRAGLSYGRWRQITTGYQNVSPGSYAVVRAPARTLARMAGVVGITPEQMETEGQRPDAAEIMRHETESLGGVSISLPAVMVPPRRPPDDDPRALHRGGALFPGMSGQMQAEVEPLFREIEARVLRAASDEARRRTEAEGRPVWIQDIIDEVPSGALVFPGGDTRAGAWDRLAARGYSAWQIAQGIAVVMALDPARHEGTGETAAGLAREFR